MAFLAHREEIRVALCEGWPRAAVHGRLRGVLGISYQQFVRYVERYLPDAPHGTAVGGSASRPSPGAAASRGRAPAPPAVPTAPPPSTSPAAPTPPPAAGALPRFTYSPGLAPRDKLV